MSKIIVAKVLLWILLVLAFSSVMSLGILKFIEYKKGRANLVMGANYDTQFTSEVIAYFIIIGMIAVAIYCLY